MPPDPPAVPTADDILSAGITALVGARPSCAPFLLAGRYLDVVDGWRAQLQVALKRLADEAAASRLDLAEGDALKQLARSECSVDQIPGPTAAIGTVFFWRSITDTTPTHTWTPGTVPAGTRLRKIGDPTKSPAVQSAEYVTLDPVYFDSTTHVQDVSLGGGQYQHFQMFSGLFGTRVQATRVGPQANRPLFSGALADAYGQIVLADTVFDTAIAVAPTINVPSDVGGGSSGFSDKDIRTFARASASGIYGPNQSAIIAGIYATGMVKHFALTEDVPTGAMVAWVTDESWGYSPTMANAVQQYLTGSQGNDPWLGFGCKLLVFPIKNFLVGVTATVMLRDPKFLTDTTDITNNIRTAVRSYFDDRPDWYIMRLNSLASIIAAADRRIMAVPTQPVVTESINATVLTDAGFPSAPVSATNPQLPVPSLAPGPFPIHLYLQDNGVDVTYQAPQ